MSDQSDIRKLAATLLPKFMTELAIQEGRTLNDVEGLRKRFENNDYEKFGILLNQAIHEPKHRNDTKVIALKKVLNEYIDSLLDKRFKEFGGQ